MHTLPARNMVPIRACLGDSNNKAFPFALKRIDMSILFVPKAWGGGSKAGCYGGSYANIVVASPGDVCSETFIEFGPYDSKKEAYKMAKYFLIKFFRTLLFLAKDSQNAARDKYRYIPYSQKYSDS